MEVCIPSNMPACQDLRNDAGSSMDPSNSTTYSPRDLSMNDLKTCLTELLIDEDQISTRGVNLSPGKNNNGNVVKEDDFKNSDKRKTRSAASGKCFSKCVSCSALCDRKSSIDGLSSEEKGQENDITSEAYEENGCTKSVDQCYSQFISRPIPLQPVSAMKGSRKKLGIAPKKLSVTWAPDVYDPIPTSVSHVPSSKNQGYRNYGKKYGKKKQKGGGKSSRSNKGKDKKQTRKNSGSTTKIKPLHDDDSLEVGSCEHQVEINDFNIVNPDPFCGSSFLKKSVTNLHFPVTEAA
ncbi:hypothetical protein CDL12_16203 [Handroanthus impetiginosus]|uniref:Uncharacterized protein n=1 Tax=Handroanthus impetiginosus TaxID=429701 RepID=A0A2G9H0Z1_9LAMI|nr:hypothetical protein CDL12_16203 [Handroanthus impetiginosus]